MNNEQVVSQLRTAVAPPKTPWLPLAWSLCLVLVVCVGDVSAQVSPLRQLECGRCHLGVAGVKHAVRDAPNLTEMKTKLRGVHLIDSLVATQASVDTDGGKRFHHGFDEAESLGIVAALQGTTLNASSLWQVPSYDERKRASEVVRTQMGCITCHDGQTSVELTGYGERIRFDYAAQFLGRIEADVSHGKALTGALSKTQRDAVMVVMSPREKHPMANRLKTAEARSDWLEAAQCARCHASSDADRYLDLRKVWGYLRQDWLMDYLTEPVPIRPTGVRTGNGWRHGHRPLPSKTARAVVKALKRIGGKARSLDRGKPLTKARTVAVKRLVRDRYGCLGCHRLGGEGGRVGPALDAVGTRLTPAAIRASLVEPHAYNPLHSMPKVSLGPHGAALDDLVQFLAYQEDQTLRDKYEHYPLLMPSVQLPKAPTSEGQALYQTYCVSCHGIDGKGNGWNAKYLTAQPMVHWRQSRLAQSTDERLVMGLARGGWVLGKSSEMPAFGGGLSLKQLQQLVQHLRVLCACEPPFWSEDKQP